MKLYRLHDTKCEANLEARFAANKWPPATIRQQIKAYTDCTCVIYAYDPDFLIAWHTPGTNPRITTRTRDMKDAESLVRKLEAETKDTAVHGYTLANRIETYISRRTELDEGTLNTYRQALGRLLEYASKRGLTHIQQLTSDFLKEFAVEGLGDNEDSTKKMHFSKVKAFLAEAFTTSPKWITEDLASSLRKFNPFKATTVSKQPYTTDEVERILQLAGTLNGKSEGYGKVPATFRLHMQLMEKTGMRVSDTLTFHPRFCERSKNGWKYFYYPTKQHKDKPPKQVWVFVPDWLKSAIESCVWMSTEYPFSYCKVYRYGIEKIEADDSTDKLTKEIRSRLEMIGKKLGIAHVGAHRFRHYFAAVMIMSGAGLENVSKALNHSNTRITEEYYLTWFQKRQTMLEDIVAGVLANPTRI